MPWLSLSPPLVPLRAARNATKPALIQDWIYLAWSQHLIKYAVAFGRSLPLTHNLCKLAWRARAVNGTIVIWSVTCPRQRRHECRDALLVKCRPLVRG